MKIPMRTDSEIEERAQASCAVLVSKTVIGKREGRLVPKHVITPFTEPHTVPTVTTVHGVDLLLTTLARMARDAVIANGPVLLDKKYRQEYDHANPTGGHCYVASEAVYVLIARHPWPREKHPITCVIDGKIAVLKPGWAPDPESGPNMTHRWLEIDLPNDSTVIVDPTAEQYALDGRTPPYQTGGRGGYEVNQYGGIPVPHAGPSGYHRRRRGKDATEIVVGDIEAILGVPFTSLDRTRPKSTTPA